MYRFSFQATKVIFAALSRFLNNVTFDAFTFETSKAFIKLCYNSKYNVPFRPLCNLCFVYFHRKIELSSFGLTKWFLFYPTAPMTCEVGCWYATNTDKCLATSLYHVSSVFETSHVCEANNFSGRWHRHGNHEFLCLQTKNKLVPCSFVNILQQKQNSLI